MCPKGSVHPCNDLGGVALGPVGVGGRDDVPRLHLGDWERVGGSSGFSAHGRVGLRGGDGGQGRGSDASIHSNCGDAECLVQGLGRGGETHAGVLEPKDPTARRWGGSDRDPLGTVRATYGAGGCHCERDVHGNGSHASIGSVSQSIGAAGLCLGRHGERGPIGLGRRTIGMNYLERH